MSEKNSNSKKTLVIDHIYDFYELYTLMYSRSAPWKSAEAMGLSYAMTQAAIRSRERLSNSQPAFNFEKEGFTVLEAFSGRGEHLPHLRLPTDLKLNNYFNNDIRDHGGACTGFVQGDALTTDFSAYGINFACALFYSMSSLHDENGSHDRKFLIRLFKNMYDSLPVGGCFFVDFCPDGYRMSLALEATNDDAPAEIVIEPDDDLRKVLNIPYHADCYLKYKKHPKYNRATATCSDYFKGPVQVIADDKVVCSVSIKHPMTQRYYSEAELTDIAREAGFKEFMFFNMNYNTAVFTLLDNVLDSSDGIDTDEADVHMANAMTVIKV